MKFVDIKNDIAFRKIFGNENKTEILISFLNAVLDFTGNRMIVEVHILNPFQLPELIKYKTTIIDIKATDQLGHYYIIEMQVADKDNFAKRIQFYTSKAYISQINKSIDYQTLKPTIFVAILDFDFLQSDTYLTKHIICNPKTGEQALKDFDYNFIELRKFNKDISECHTLVDKWIYFIKNAETLHIIPNGTIDNGLSAAYHDANKITWSSEELELYDYAGMRERDAIEEREKANEKAIEKAVDDKVIAVVKEFYKNGASIELIAISIKLSVERVKEILETA